MNLLSDFVWKTKYDSDSGSLLGDFFEPALSCAVRYDRTTGYFSSRVLTLASRGIEGLIRNGGRMRLIVGCTLDANDVEAITRGQSLRETVSARFGATPLAPESQGEERALELLAWMVAQGFLEVKVAVPCDSARRPVVSTVLFHEKAGIVEDKTGDRLAFNGGVNETPQGWQGNWDSFHVFCSWTGDDGGRHVEDEEVSFSRLWNDKGRACLVLDVPSAVRQDLLRFLPQEGSRPHKLEGDAQLEIVSAPPPEPEPTTGIDLRRLVWGVIRHSPGLSNGERVGEATSVVTPWPHQVQALERLYRRWPPRLLVADEVGLGKTIEVGLVLRQAWLSGRSRRILVLAPKALLRQWQVELREKLNLSWPIYDGQRLLWPSSPGCRVKERKVSRNEWHLEPFVIASSQLVRRQERRDELVGNAVAWDLIVLDEAHHARRKGGGLTKDKAPNKLLGLMRDLVTKSQGLILMTATPMQVNPVEVWDLLDLLGLPSSWNEGAFLSFFQKVETPNPSYDDFDFLASMFRASEKAWGPLSASESGRILGGLSNLGRRKILEALRDPARTARRQLPTDRRKEALRLMKASSPVARLVSRYTRELLRSYYRAGRITTRIADREVADVFVEFTPGERDVYDRIEEYITTSYNQAAAAERNAVGFIMTVYRKRVASSFYALCETLERRLSKVAGKGDQDLTEEDLPDDEAADELLDIDEAADLARGALVVEETGVLQELLAAARALPEDSKAGELLRQLQGLRESGYSQVLVFTQFTDTLDFLKDRLENSGFPVLCFSGRGGEYRGLDGRWVSVSREDVKRMFRQGKSEILLCTDAAAEGLNFQFCGAMVNYDMPWNPMRVEQRIGRIDRVGQRYAVMRIVNLHYEGTVETDVYGALRNRINLFVRTIGKLQPILASLPSQIQRAALKPRGERDTSRFVEDLQSSVRAAEAEGFDLDSMVETDLEEPVRTPAPYDLKALDEIIQREDLLPPGVEAGALAAREYRYCQPGLPAAVRVTTDPEFFDEHSESVELWSPGSPIFPEPESVATVEEVRGESRSLSTIIKDLSPSSESPQHVVHARAGEPQ
jgi:SNF2 family DNA or RNA helicase